MTNSESNIIPDTTKPTNSCSSCKTSCNLDSDYINKCNHCSNLYNLTALLLGWDHFNILGVGPAPFRGPITLALIFPAAN